MESTGLKEAAEKCLAKTKSVPQRLNRLRKKALRLVVLVWRGFVLGEVMEGRGV
jgi:hypothetical protein